jgi:hypothetical protein
MFSLINSQPAITEVPPQTPIMEDEMDMIDPEDPQPLSSNENTVMETKRSNQNLHNPDTTVRVMAPSTRKQMDPAVNSTNPEGVVPAKKPEYNQITSNASSTEVAKFWNTKNTKIQIDNLERKTKVLTTNPNLLPAFQVPAGIGILLCLLGVFGFACMLVGQDFGFINPPPNHSWTFKILFLIGIIAFSVYMMLSIHTWKYTSAQLTASILMIICGIICFVLIIFWKINWDSNMKNNVTYIWELCYFKYEYEVSYKKTWEITVGLGILYLIFGISGLLDNVGACYCKPHP